MLGKNSKNPKDSNSLHCQSIQYFDALIHTATMSSMAVDCLVPSMTNPIAIPAASPVGREPHINRSTGMLI